MLWIALKMLTGDRAKFFGIVLGLTFAALLIDQQGSIFCGLMCRTAGQIYDITGADLWVMDANVRYIDDVKPMIENDLYRIRGVPGVKWAVPLYKGQARAKVNSAGVDWEALEAKGAERKRAGLGPLPEADRPTRLYKVIEQVILLGLDDATLVGAPRPESIYAGDLTRLREPDAVIVDYTRLSKLFPGEDYSAEPKDPSDIRTFLAWAGRGLDWSRHEVGRALGLTSGTWDPGPSLREMTLAAKRVYYRRFLGRQIEMNDRRALIVGVCEATRTFQSNAVIYTTYSRAKRFAPQERKVLTYVLAKAEGRDADGRPVDPKAVALAIKRQTGLKALTSREFIDETIDYFMKYTGIPVNFGITTLLGFLVGTAIAGQTFYNFTLENIKQFGALKAMGATNLMIVAMILVQATVVGLLGLGLGLGLASLFGMMTTGGELAFYTPWQLLPITAGAVVLICIFSSVLSLRRVVVLEPAVVFRG